MGLFTPFTLAIFPLVLWLVASFMFGAVFTLYWSRFVRFVIRSSRYRISRIEGGWLVRQKRTNDLDEPIEDHYEVKPD